MKLLRKIFSHSLIYALGPQVPKIAGLIVLPLITLHLTAVDFGIYGILTSYTGLLTGMADLGISVVLVNSFFKYPKKWRFIWRQLHFYLLLWSGVFSVLMAILLFFVIPANQGDKLMTIIALVCLPTLFFNSTIIIASRYYQFAQKPFYISITSAIVGIVAIFLNYYTIAVLKMGYIGWFYSTAIASAIQFLFYFFPVYFKYKLSPIFVFRNKFLHNNLKIALPTIPHNYSSYLLNSSDRIVMDNLNVRVSEIGKFNMAYTFGNYFEFFGNAVGMAVGPFLTSIHSKGTDKSKLDYAFLTNWLQYSFILLALLLSLWSKEFMAILISNNELKLVYPISIIIIMGYAYRPYYWAIINIIQYSENTSQLWKISFVAGILNVILNIVLIPIWGIMAAAVTTFVSLMYMGFSGYYLKNRTKIDLPFFRPLRIIFIIISTTVLVFFAKDINYLGKGIITGLLLFVYMFYFIKFRSTFYKIDI